jgi:hypothetical protein
MTRLGRKYSTTSHALVNLVIVPEREEMYIVFVYLAQLACDFFLFYWITDKRAAAKTKFLEICMSFHV